MMPLHVRAGAVIPMGPVKQYTAQPDDGPLSVIVYPGADGSFDLFEDDGRSFEYRRGDWMGISIKWTDASRRVSLSLTPGSRMRPPLPRRIDVRLAGSHKVQRIAFAGRSMTVRL